MKLALFKIKFQQLFRYLRFFFWSKTKYDIHSPFVSDFITHVLEDNRYYYTFPFVIWFRKKLLKDKRVIEVIDYGAGSKVNSKKQRKVKEIARYSPVSPYIGSLLFKTIHHYQPQILVELGTSLGLSTLYQALANKGAMVYTIEGCPNTSELALETFKHLNATNVELVNATFEEGLVQLGAKTDRFDYVFIDGDHSLEGSLAYFDQIQTFLHDKSIVIFADIYWSKEMMQAWKKVKEHQKVKLSIDLFQIGILFFDPAIKAVQHVQLVPWYWKPWRLGLYR